MPYERLAPEILCDEGLAELAALYSEETGETWAPRPAAEVSLTVFADLLELAEEDFWQNFEKGFHVTPEAAKELGIDVELALTRCTPQPQ